MTALSIVATERSSASHQTLYAAERAAYLGSVVKVLCGLVVAVCFWYAVPYVFPLRLDPDPLRAAANEATAYEGNLSRQLALPVVFIVSAYAYYRLPKLAAFRRSSKLAGIAISYMAWAFTSLVWSEDPHVSGKRLIVFGIDVLFATALAYLVEEDELALFGFAVTGSVALIALGADLFVLHAFDPLDPEYRFMGVMTANYQAMNLFVCLICGLTLAQRSSRWLRWLSPLLALFAGLLFLTRARIGTLLFLAAATFIAVRLGRQWLQPQGRAVALLATLTILLPGAVFAIGHSGRSAVSNAFMMGRHDTENTASLSNRAPLWSELMDSVEEHPLLGFGFEAFWSAERVQKISLDQGWVVPHAHNSYLDQVLSLGVIGFLFYTAMLIGACVVAWQRYSHLPNATTLMPALLLSWLVMLGFTESIPIAPNLPGLIAYSCIARMCQQKRSEQELAAERPGAVPLITRRWQQPMGAIGRTVGLPGSGR